MKVWKDRDGKPVEVKEFFSRWKSGIQKVTPLQQAGISVCGYIIVLIGILWGITITWKLKTWWLLVILTGSLIISGLQLLGVLQKYLVLSNIQKQIKEQEVKNEQERTI